MNFFRSLPILVIALGINAGPISKDPQLTAKSSSIFAGNDIEFELRQIGISDDVQVLTVNGTEMCQVNKILYQKGADLPVADPCEYCICNPPGFACEVVECTHKPGCRALERSGLCCPEYVCDCQAENGTIYDNTDFVPSSDPCKQCFCKTGEIVCSVIACPLPPPIEENCSEVKDTSKCCPTYVNCTQPPALVEVAADPVVEGAPEETTLSPVEEVEEQAVLSIFAASDIESDAVIMTVTETPEEEITTPPVVVDIDVPTATEVEVSTDVMSVDIDPGVNELTPGPLIEAPNLSGLGISYIIESDGEDETVPDVEMTTQAAVTEGEEDTEVVTEVPSTDAEEMTVSPDTVIDISENMIEYDGDTKPEEISDFVGITTEQPSDQENEDGDDDETADNITTVSSLIENDTDEELTSSQTENQSGSEQQMFHAITFPVNEELEPGNFLSVFPWGPTVIAPVSEGIDSDDDLAQATTLFPDHDEENDISTDTGVFNSEDAESSFWFSMLLSDHNDAKEDGVKVGETYSRINNKLITIEDEVVSDGSVSHENPKKVVNLNVQFASKKSKSEYKLVPKKVETIILKSNSDPESTTLLFDNDYVTELPEIEDNFVEKSVENSFRDGLEDDTETTTELVDQSITDIPEVRSNLKIGEQGIGERTESATDVPATEPQVFETSTDYVRERSNLNVKIIEDNNIDDTAHYILETEAPVTEAFQLPAEQNEPVMPSSQDMYWLTMLESNSLADEGKSKTMDDKDDATKSDSTLETTQIPLEELTNAPVTEQASNDTDRDADGQQRSENVIPVPEPFPELDESQIKFLESLSRIDEKEPLHDEEQTENPSETPVTEQILEGPASKLKTSDNNSEIQKIVKDSDSKIIEKTILETKKTSNQPETQSVLLEESSTDSDSSPDDSNVETSEKIELVSNRVRKVIRKPSRISLRKRPLVGFRKNYRVITSNESKDAEEERLKLLMDEDEILQRHMDAHFLKVARKYGLRPLTVKRKSLNAKRQKLHPKFPLPFRRPIFP